MQRSAFALVFALAGLVACNNDDNQQPDTNVGTDTGLAGEVATTADTGSATAVDSAVPDDVADTAPSDTAIPDDGAPPDETIAPGCCATDADCEGRRCVGATPGQADGACVDLPAQGACYADRDCGGAQCVDAMGCGCLVDCISRPGTCQGTPACCATDTDCAAVPAGSEVCVAGLCVPAPAAGACYAEGDCAATESCEGETICPCMAMCFAATTPGKCAPLPDNCCHSDADCADNTPATKCAALTPDNPGVCTKPPESGACYDHGDCDGGYCDLVSHCGCGLKCALMQGSCHTLPSGCCASDADCGDKEVCVPSEFLPAGRCEPAPTEAGTCWTDLACAPGELCVGASVCPCGALCVVADKPGKCEPVATAGCCASDNDCSEGQTCAGDVAGGEKGVCEPGVGLGKCWEDGECPLGATCEGEYVCGCNDVCMIAIVDRPGTCEATSPGCCLTDRDCTGSAEPQRCVGLGPNSAGQCMPAPASGSCYSDADCPSGMCDSVTACGCMMDCMVAAGDCVPLSGGCCKTDGDCEGSDVCVGASAEAAGVCEPAPTGNACWSSADCTPGNKCVGASACPCGALCILPDHPGECKPTTPPACCWLDEQCGAGFECAHELSTSSLGPCVPQAGPGACWDDQDCGVGTSCVGASYCPCGVDCDAIEKPGKCLVDEGGCCLADTDCHGGMTCEGEGGGATGVCKAAPAAGDCWSEAQCAAGEACVDERICPCAASCIVADAPGKCQALPSACCHGDTDCGDGMVCEGTGGSLPGACKPDPTGPACPTDAACCWTADDCGKGMLCKGARVCGCIEPCPMCGDCAPDEMGTCEPGAGACCESAADCPRDYVCAGAGSDGFGAVCEPPPDAGACWDDAQCGPGLHCTGARVCRCGALCILADAPGKCAP